MAPGRYGRRGPAARRRRALPEWRAGVRKRSAL